MRPFLRCTLFAVTLATPVASSAAQAGTGLLITGGLIADGSGNAPVVGDVRIRGDEIVEIAPALTAAPGEQVVDARGLVVTPGFIDTHSHHDRGILGAPTVPSATSQGITTIVVGQDGSSELPLGDWFAKLEAAPPAVNVASYSGHGTLRSDVMGDDFARPATEAETRRMEELLAADMQAGALGLASGLEYDPGIYSTTAEMIALARVSARFGGRYISHVRSEDVRFWEAIEEIIEIGRATNAPVQVSHMKLAMTSLWGQTKKLIDRLEAARRSGIAITADAYPYEHWQTTMRVLFPDRDYTDRTAAAFALKEVVTPENMLITSFDASPEIEGKTLLEVSMRLGRDPVGTLIELIGRTFKFEKEHGYASDTIIGKGMQEADVSQILAWEHTNISSDGSPSGGHPRAYGAFTRFLGRFVRDGKLMPLASAVRKMTALAADHVGIRDRGRLAPGYKADVVLLDAQTVTDRATFTAPQALSDGIAHVYVNGIEVFANGRATGMLPGRVVRR